MRCSVERAGECVDTLHRLFDCVNNEAYKPSIHFYHALR